MDKQFVNRVVELTNHERTKAGLPSLQPNPQLMIAAGKHAMDMALEDYFSHFDPNEKTKPSQRITQTGYNWAHCAENIYAGGETPEKAVKGWMESPGHCANILDPNLQEIGVGYYHEPNDSGDVKYKHYWVQVFATPKRK